MSDPVAKQVSLLALNPLMWKIWWAPNNASRWRMGFNSAFKRLISRFNVTKRKLISSWTSTLLISYGSPACLLANDLQFVATSLGIWLANGENRQIFIAHTVHNITFF
jgi:hypothetical protein